MAGVARDCPGHHRGQQPADQQSTDRQKPGGSAEALQSKLSSDTGRHPFKYRHRTLRGL